MTLTDQLATAQAEVERLKRQIAGAACVEIGTCDWRFVGGKNVGCDEQCCCSVPVHQCSRCGDCDYGDNEEARQVIAECGR